MASKLQRFGFAVYLLGIVVYFSSWLAVIYWPASTWSMSAVGFTAAAYTSVVYLKGIGLIGQNSFLKLRWISKIYILASLLFEVFHTLRAYLAFLKLQREVDIWSMVQEHGALRQTQGLRK